LLSAGVLSNGPIRTPGPFRADVPDWGNFFAQFGQSLVATGRSAKVKDFGCRPVVTYPRVRRAGERGSPQRVVKLADRIISNGSR